MITNIITTNPSIQTTASDCGMPVCGHVVLGTTWVTGQRSVDLRIPVIARLRAVAPKGHMGIAAYVPGVHAWSPPV
ncbi:hypothetical protein NPS01_24770 [Nocardioides psychrotolerans]|uniref:Uncharacterized protein n=1 Tax=Nocardioides psychrotolerans TaxID=1005945 RepID=A0A1I3L4X3_9ACTN|nr:hypothetical protein [Nocardioides psychrotolerans]GEP38814.1 hypothetical protein NPS01_24770 [Nocardioides psychrotolerans]SFI79728.1 hypothetical protein SAMN05216561_11326 [Nocardioides psychrotolerans]